MADESTKETPSVNIHLSRTGQVQITFAGAVCAMDEAAGEAVLTIHASQLQELHDALAEFLPNQE